MTVQVLQDHTEQKKVKNLRRDTDRDRDHPDEKVQGIHEIQMIPMTQTQTHRE